MDWGRDLISHWGLIFRIPIKTNHYYQKGEPDTIKNNLNNTYKLIKEFKVDNITINSIYKVNDF